MTKDPLKKYRLPDKKIEKVLGKITQERYLARHCTNQEAKALIEAQVEYMLKVQASEVQDMREAIIHIAIHYSLQVILWAQSSEWGEAKQRELASTLVADKVAPLLASAREEGRQKVIEWLNKYRPDSLSNNCYYLRGIPYEDWQALVKDKGGKHG